MQSPPKVGVTFLTKHDVVFGSVVRSSLPNPPDLPLIDISLRKPHGVLNCFASTPRSLAYHLPGLLKRFQIADTKETEIEAILALVSSKYAINGMTKKWGLIYTFFESITRAFVFQKVVQKFPRTSLPLCTTVHVLLLVSTRLSFVRESENQVITFKIVAPFSRPQSSSRVNSL